MGNCSNCAVCENNQDIYLSQQELQPQEDEATPVQQKAEECSKLDETSKVDETLFNSIVTDFTPAKHLPSLEVARPMTKEEQMKYKVPDNILQVFKKVGPMEIRKKVPQYVMSLPQSDQPYLIHQSGAVYIGQWKLGQPYGKGIFYLADGSVYEGISVNGTAELEGRKFWPDGSYYVGEFREGQCWGEGELIKKNGFRYKGGWQANLPDGLGRETWPDGTSYTGNYAEGRKKGEGKFEWPGKGSRKDAYEGQFARDLFEGKGVYLWGDGRRYEGEWQEGKMHGKGVFTWKDGRKYEGEYKDDYKDGYGCFSWPNGKSWEGEWSKGKMDGQGTIRLANGKVYLGEWRKGKRVRWLKSEQAKSVISVASIPLSIRDEQQYLEQSQMNEAV